MMTKTNFEKNIKYDARTFVYIHVVSKNITSRRGSDTESYRTGTSRLL